MQRAFLYFCSKQTVVGDASFSMGSNAWSAFCREVRESPFTRVRAPLPPSLLALLHFSLHGCGGGGGLFDVQLEIEDSSTGATSSGRLCSLFVETNFEEESTLSKEEDEENDNKALMRFEWLEILVRVAVLKYMEGTKEAKTVGESVRLLSRRNLALLPPEATIDSNDFRRDRLYTERMNSLLLVSKPCHSKENHFLAAVLLMHQRLLFWSRREGSRCLAMFRASG